MLIGEEGLDRLSASCVAVIGVGGVGGYAAEMIARAGVGHIIIMDSDDVSVTNKNRQLLALDSTVGRPKCDVMRERLLDINPQLDITVIKEYLEADSPEAVLGGYRIDFLVDAIDTLATKVRLADISKSFNCPLAFVVRKRLRRMGIRKGFKVVFSEELPRKEAIVECDDRNKKSLVGTVSYIPAVFGCVCAQAALESLLSN